MCWGAGSPPRRAGVRGAPAAGHPSPCPPPGPSPPRSGRGRLASFLLPLAACCSRFVRSPGRRCLPCLPSAVAAAHHQNMQDELLLGVTQQQQPGSERLGSSPASGHPPLGHPSSDFKPCLSPHQDLNKQQAQQPQPPPPQLSQKRKEFKQQLSSPAQLGSSHPLNNHHPPDYHHHPPQQQQQQFSHPTDKYQQQEHRQQQQLQLLSAQPPEPPRTGDHSQHRPVGPAEHQGSADRGGSELFSPSCPGGSVSADPNVGVAAASCVNPPSSPHLQARAKRPPMESPPNSHLLGSPGNLLPGGLGSGFSSLQSPEIPSPHHQSGGGSSSAASPPPPPLPGFGTPWSVQTSSPPPQQTQQPPVSSGGGGGGQISAMPPPSPESETSFYPGIPSSINPAFFQSFSPVSPHNPCAGPFSSPFSAAAPPPPPQMNLPQQQQQQQQNRRSPVSPQLQHQHQAAAAAAAFLQQRNSYNHHQVPGGGRGGDPRGGDGGRGEGTEAPLHSVSRPRKPGRFALAGARGGCAAVTARRDRGGGGRAGPARPGGREGTCAPRPMRHRAARGVCGQRPPRAWPLSPPVPGGRCWGSSSGPPR